MNIGRLGALAIALGIGWALGGPACTASAAPSEDDGASTAASADSGGQGRASVGKRNEPRSANLAAAQTTSAARAGGTGAAVASEKARNDAPPATASTPRPAATGVAVPAATATVDTGDQAVVVTADADSEPVESLTATFAPLDLAAPFTAAPTAAAQTTAAQTTAAQSRANRAHRAVAVVATAQVVDAADPLSGSGSGDAPAQGALAWSVAAWARRESGRSAAAGKTASAVPTAALVMSPNLLANPGAEVGDASLSGNSAVSVPGWTLTGTPTVIGYGTPRNAWPVGTSFPMPNLPAFMGFPTAGSGPADGGAQFFGGGNVATSTLTQTVDLSAAGAAIDLGTVTYNLGGWLGGWLINPSAASVKVSFLDTNQTYLGSASIGPVSMLERFFQTGLKERETSGLLPEGTRYAQVVLNLEACNPIPIGFNAAYNPAFADNLSFTISEPLPAAPDPTPAVSVVGDLDHVFMVYMENKGFDDIYQSPNAPFINSLINAYGFANNYYGLTHGSLPNYYPIVGGSDFGKTYNCATPCIATDTTLVSNIDAAGKTWRSYAQSLEYGGDPLVSSGDYAVDETPFPAFESIANDPAYAKEHIVPLEQMAIDLQSVDTAPDFAWFAANEDFNGEGPVDFPWGILKFALSQISPDHQYNVPALDQYLSETVPVVLNSNVWNDPNVSSALVVTFDEDNNNTSLGFGNEGNHIVTVVIPSPGAIAAGMRSGSYTATNHYNHYSLLRMIEDALNLPTLTDNDKYAAPMNEFWVAGVTGGAESVV